MLRRLRIAWTVFFAMLAIALIVLWVLSYWWMESVLRISANGYFVGILSASGGAQLQGLPYPGWTPTLPGWSPGWHIRSETNSLQGRSSDFIWVLSPMLLIRAPYWLYVVIASVGSGAPWLSYRFSLRTMLIATTVVAAALGLIVWASR